MAAQHRETSRCFLNLICRALSSDARGNLYFGMLLRTAKDKLYWGYGRITQQTLVFQLWKISHKAHAYQPGKTCGCDLCLTEKVVILLGHDGPEKIPRSTILLNRRTELLQKCRHKRKFTYAGMTSRQKKWNYEYPGNPTGTEDWKRKLWGEGSPIDQEFFSNIFHSNFMWNGFDGNS